eukprot:2433168-Rhodomonas_salina.1
MVGECCKCFRKFGNNRSTCWKSAFPQFEREASRAGTTPRPLCCVCVQRNGFPARACGPCQDRGALSEPIAQYESKGMLSSKCKHCGRAKKDHETSFYIKGYAMCRIPASPPSDDSPAYMSAGAPAAPASRYPSAPALTMEQVKAKLNADARAWQRANASAAASRQKWIGDEKERWEMARQKEQDEDRFDDSYDDFGSSALDSVVQPSSNDYGGDAEGFDCDF